MLPNARLYTPGGATIPHRNPPHNAIASAAINVLAVSPFEADYTTLREMLPERWVLSRAGGIRDAVSQLRRSPELYPIILCEAELGRQSWRDLLEHAVQMPAPPLLIVSSRLADERLWAEALCLGAYDVLAKPFDRDEVNRVLGSAWARSARRCAMPAGTADTRLQHRAAG